MLIKRQEDVTPVVLDAFKNTADPRVREILTALVKHLHAFARDVHLTEEEFEKAVQLRHRARPEDHRHPQRSGADVRLARLLDADLPAQQRQQRPDRNHGQSARAVLAHEFAAHRKRRLDRALADAGAGAVRQLLRSRTSNGKPIEGAEVDVWHSSPEGFYEQQDPKQADMNLRGKFMTDAQGHFGSAA